MIELPIPIRPDNDSEFNLRRAEKDLLLVKYLFGYSNTRAFALFNPHLATERGTLTRIGSEMCNQFFSHPKNIEWLENYERTLLAALKGVSKPSTHQAEEEGEISEETLDKYYRIYTRKMLQDLADDKELDSDTKKLFMEYFKRMGKFKEDAEAVMKPVRVLPTRCKSECRYRLAIESLKTQGEIMDDCEYCKARAFAEERGFKYDAETVLDVPQEVIDKIDAMNDVAFEDIISGKVEN